MGTNNGKETAIDLVLDTPILESDTSAEEMYWYRFVPPLDGIYRMRTTGHESTVGWLYNEDSTVIDLDHGFEHSEYVDGFGWDSNFHIIRKLTQGTVYYLGIEKYNSIDFSVEVTRLPIVELSLISPPEKTSYVARADWIYGGFPGLDLTGLVAGGITEDGESITLTADMLSFDGATHYEQNTRLPDAYPPFPCEIWDYDSEAPYVGNVDIFVRRTDADGVWGYGPNNIPYYSTGSVAVPISIIMPIRMEIVQPPTKTQYDPHEPLDLRGLSYRLVYNDNTTSDIITCGDDFDPANHDYYDDGTTWYNDVCVSTVGTLDTSSGYGWWNIDTGYGLVPAESGEYTVYLYPYDCLNYVGPANYGHVPEMTSAPLTFSVCEPAGTKFTVDFLDWDGAVLKSQTVNDGGAATAPDNPARAGYVFSGWSDKFDCIHTNLEVKAIYYEIFETDDTDSGMDLLTKIYDMNLNLLAVIDGCKSLLRTDRYRNCGEFEMKISAAAVDVSTLKRGFFIVFSDGSAYRLEKFSTDVGFDGTDLVTISGRDLKAIYEQRIVWGTRTVTGSAWNRMYWLMYYNAYNPPENDYRRMPFVGNAESPLLLEGEDRGNSKTTQYTACNLLEALTDIMATERCGWRTELDIDSKTIFSTFYSGTDRTTQCKFISVLGDLENVAYSYDSTGLKNVARIGGEGEGINRKWCGVDLTGTASGTYTGFHRRELGVDARDLQSESQDNSGMTTVMDETAYTFAMMERGIEKLSTATESYELSFDAGQNYVYGEDYFLGDIVTVDCRNELGEELRCRIVGVQRSQDANGSSVYPIFAQESDAIETTVTADRGTITTKPTEEDSGDSGDGSGGSSSGGGTSTGFNVISCSSLPANPDSNTIYLVQGTVVTS